ncbi:M20 family metallopeptidase [Ponticaulis sp.]|uniref:M20 metallopeptidase family protein n=1 Tax=Ponticaulis sp. TaxID=2020902 RepID=UPI000B62FB54|nr:amidohydrolase [Ponticaulis sp.]MAI91929.1 peptidase M20 [Ponticaulis sp.]OUX96470.1 MAG: peptidase M20 [Hyphomonadaceae bacterium TMED5]
MKNPFIRAGVMGLGAIALSQIASAQQPESGADLVTVYEYLHAHPELSLQEANSSAYLASEIEALGFTVTTGLGDDWVREKALREQGVVRENVGGYGVVAILENGPGPTLLIRADMDGLPVPEQTGFPFASEQTSTSWTGVEGPVMHACGHDVHMTSWLGTARNLVERRDEWSGTLIMILQPAEEIGLGALAMLEDGLFDDYPQPDYNLALHVNSSMPSGTLGYVGGYSMANVDSVDIIVHGVGGHGAYPHTTVDPIVVAAHIITSVQTLVSRNVNPQDAAVVTVGSIVAGHKHNIIPDEAHLQLTVRSFSDEVRALLMDGIVRIANGQAEAFGAPPPDITSDPDYTPSNYNDPDLSERMGRVFRDVLGDESVSIMSPVMGGEDFSRYGRTGERIPGMLFWIGAVSEERYMEAQNGGLPLPSLHSGFFAPDYEATIETGVTAMTAAALDLLQPEE